MQVFLLWQVNFLTMHHRTLMELHSGEIRWAWLLRSESVLFECKMHQNNLVYVGEIACQLGPLTSMLPGFAIAS